MALFIKFNKIRLRYLHNYTLLNSEIHAHKSQIYKFKFSLNLRINCCLEVGPIKKEANKTKIIVFTCKLVIS